jgi:hypothetical protein
MIYVEDNFLDLDNFNDVNSNINNCKFTPVDVGDSFFHVQNSTKKLNNYVIKKLEKIEGKKLTNIMSFFRVATDKLDTSWRIHSDLIVNGEKPDRALVFYLSPKKRTDLHGTAFWNHHVHGEKLFDNCTNEEYDTMIKSDSNDLTKWKLRQVVDYKPNRLVSYPANYFHSKYPNEGWKEGRKVFVMFYKFK